MRIFVDMNNSHSMSRAPQPVQLNHAKAELRELLESNLVALVALLEQHQRTLDQCMRTIAGVRAEIRALSDARAPWVKALADTRAMLFVALHEVVAAGPPASDTLVSMPAQAGDTTMFERVAG
ncbi:MAG TPA: hypothetical protein VFQ53_24550 [Kofleriaceae bacterium]|nr:hypothetical protein [Kofleriaceae bacterium]